MSEQRTDLVVEVSRRLAAHGAPARAVAQQRYMKSLLPYHGVPSPVVALICREVFQNVAFADAAEWERTALSLWDGATHREEWYVALQLLRLRRYHAWATAPGLVPTLRHLIASGAWWDVVDDIASHLVGDLLRARPSDVAPTIRAWATDPDPWLRRAAILSQLGSKRQTDTDLLAYALTSNLTDPGFFLRKGIGWALREYAKTDPAWVLGFVSDHRGSLSTLSRREALKHLDPQ